MKKIILLLSISFVLSSTQLSAQSLIPDATFGTNGRTITPINTASGLLWEDVIKAIVIQPDGKIVVAGYSLVNSTNDISLARYNTDGTLDNSFGSGGKVITTFGFMRTEAFSIALQSDGKIVVAGCASTDAIKYDFALLRYNSNGTLDNTFGPSSNGRVTFPVSTENDFATCMAIQPDGMIVLGGFSEDDNTYYTDFALARYNPATNALDPGFGGTGVVSTSVSPYHDEIYSLVIQSDGKIIVGGNANLSGDRDFAVARYNSNGTLDATFDVDGIVTNSVGSANDYINSITIQSDGRYVAAGYLNNGTNFDFALARYNTDGSQDITFDTDGEVTSAIGPADDVAKSVIIQADGKILVAGYSDELVYEPRFVMARYTPSGLPDNTFSSTGFIVTSATAGNRGEVANDIAIQSDGKVVLGGYSINGATDDRDYCVDRYMIDVTFGISDLNEFDTEVSLYPNPVIEYATLAYTLENSEEISLSLFDSQGKMLKDFFINEKRNSGVNHEIISMPEDISYGTYFIYLETSSGKKSMIKILK